MTVETVGAQEPLPDPPALRRLARRETVTVPNLTLAEEEQRRKLEEAISAKQQDAVDAQRRKLNSLFQLRLDEMRVALKDADAFSQRDQKSFRRLELAAKGVVEKQIAEQVRDAAWFQKESLKLLKQMRMHQISLAEAVKNINYTSQYATDVDTIITMVHKVEKMPRWKKGLEKFTPKQRELFVESKIRRLKATQSQFRELTVALIDQFMLMTPQQDKALRSLLTKKIREITPEMLEKTDDFESIIVSYASLKKSDLHAVFSRSQAEWACAIMSEFGVEFADDAQQAQIAAGEGDGDPVQQVAQIVEGLLGQDGQAKKRVASSQLPPKVLRQLLAETRTRVQGIYKECLSPLVAHAIRLGQLSDQESKKLNSAFETFISAQLEIHFKPAYEAIDRLEKTVPHDKSNPKSNNKKNTMTMRDLIALTGLENFEANDWSHVPGVTERITKLDDWKALIRSNLTKKQYEAVRVDRFRRKVKPGRAYMQLMVHWIDRAMCLPEKKIVELKKLVRRYEKPISPQDLGDDPTDVMWQLAMNDMGRVPVAELKKIMNPAQVSIWKDTVKEFGVEVAVEEVEELLIEEEFENAEAEAVPQY